MEAQTGTVFVVTAPSGAGKSTLVDALLARDPTIALSVSHTTRLPRIGEQYGRHYYFVEHEQFEREVAAGLFLEHAQVHGNLYGTSRKTVQALLEQGRDVLLEIDWQGARQIQASMPDCVSVFILPPSRTELERRLRHRAADTTDVIERRLRNSRDEIAQAQRFSYIIINDRFDDALSDLQAIIHTARLRTTLQWQRHQALITPWLNPG